MTRSFLSILDTNFKGKRVLVRVDFNVPIADGKVTDDTRIRESLPTLEKLRKDGARLILCSHLGRPGGKSVPAFTLRPVAAHLSELLGTPVAFSEKCTGPTAEKAVEKLKPGEVLLLENLRFHADEEENNPAFAESLAQLAEVYVNDAFGTAHRAHASTTGVAAHLPAYAGLLLKKELDILGQLLSQPHRPFVAVLGGAKVSDKLAMIQNLLPRVDSLLVGGAMAFTFSAAMGGRVGTSFVEREKISIARDLLRAAKEAGKELLLPLDVVIAQELKGGGPTSVVPFGEIPDGWKGVDVGPKTVARFSERLISARTVFVNGPMGVFEVPAFAKGTCGVLTAVSNCEGTTIVGGGDSAAALGACGLAHGVSHVSTGGGASMELLEGKVLPGVAALERYAQAVPR